ncbi:DUF2029 domain-containing protein [Pseudonocardiaceae bacterium YIM PH 21723]|nr:DUF2029 domain-containing protein [Pseudonocardiaceae bacterium YIM PH 21723]
MSKILVILLLGAAAFQALKIGLLSEKQLSALGDAHIYRAGAAQWWQHGSVYTAKVAGAPEIIGYFTYPPFALLGLGALLVNFQLGVIVLLLASVAAIFHTLLLIGRRILPANPHLAPISAAVTLGLLTIPPVYQTLWLGQINALLIWLVAVDCLHRNPRVPRGMLVGIAAAIKLTPAAFVLFFLAGRQWRAAATAVGTFLGCTGLMWVLAPTASAEFWLHALWDPTRVGGAWQWALVNQSLKGTLYRAELTDPGNLGKVWAVACLVTVILTALAAFRLRRRGDVLLSWFAVAAMTVLICPISWDHHWVWITGLVFALGLWSVRDGRPLTILATLATVGALYLANDLRYRAADLAPWILRITNEYLVIIGVVTLLTAVVLSLRRPRERVPEPGEFQDTHQVVG